MGVMACNRKNCDNILCNFISYNYGYLCGDCINELEEKEGISFSEFMETPPQETIKLKSNWKEIVNKEFKRI